MFVHVLHRQVDAAATACIPWAYESFGELSVRCLSSTMGLLSGLFTRAPEPEPLVEPAGALHLHTADGRAEIKPSRRRPDRQGDALIVAATPQPGSVLCRNAWPPQVDTDHAIVVGSILLLAVAHFVIGRARNPPLGVARAIKRLSRRLSSLVGAAEEGKPARRVSIVPWDPHPKWSAAPAASTRSGVYPGWRFFALLLVGLVVVIFEGSFETVRLFYTTCSLSLMAYRLKYFRCVDVPRRRVAATPWLRRGYFAETSARLRYYADRGLLLYVRSSVEIAAPPPRLVASRPRRRRDPRRRRLSTSATGSTSSVSRRSGSRTFRVIGRRRRLCRRWDRWAAPSSCSSLRCSCITPRRSRASFFTQAPSVLW